MDERIAAARRELGRDLVILGHHYQRDEVIRFADFRGDSYKLSQQAAAAGGKYIVFCGVHFMAESADILTPENVQVILPDLGAGCSMADMAALPQVEECWDRLAELGLAADTVPVTYMNSSADIKGFVGRRVEQVPVDGVAPGTAPGGWGCPHCPMAGQLSPAAQRPGWRGPGRQSPCRCPTAAIGARAGASPAPGQ